MANSVSNDALWVKLSEIEEKINKCLKAQEQVDISPALKANKDEIADIIKRCIQGLGTHCDSHFKVIHENIKLSNGLTKDGFQILSYMWAWMQEKGKERDKTEQEKIKPKSVQEADNSCPNLKFFKVRKISLVIAVLGLLTFILTLFNMKQQDDYSLLLNEYYRQSIEISEMQVKLDSLQKAVIPTVKKKK